jgi:hypothetical protein
MILGRSKRTNFPFFVRSDALEPIFLISQLERFDAALHDFRNLTVDLGDIYRAGEFDLSTPTL